LQANVPSGINGNRTRFGPKLAAEDSMVDATYAKQRQHLLADVPTLIVAVGTYSAWGLLTWYHAILPWWMLLPCGAYLVCLHGGLQHEAVHGFPFRQRWLNAALVFPSLWLWLPYLHYRRTHTLHHRDLRLTCPVDDPESYYVTGNDWERMGAFHRSVRLAMNTLAGRLVIGPLYASWRLLVELLDSVVARDPVILREWAWHLPAVAIVVWWVVGVCGMPFWQYVVLFAYPGLSLTLMRSFAEHRARKDVGERTILVEAGPVMSLLYLNNNLHAMHHADPSAPWHRRWAQYRERREALLAENGQYLFRGYGELLRRYLFTAKEPVRHPVADL